MAAMCGLECGGFQVCDFAVDALGVSVPNARRSPLMFPWLNTLGKFIPLLVDYHDTSSYVMSGNMPVSIVVFPQRWQTCS